MRKLSSLSVLVVGLALSGCVPEQVPIVTTAPTPVDVPDPTPLPTPPLPTPPPEETGCGADVPEVVAVDAYVEQDALQLVLELSDADGGLSQGLVQLQFDDRVDGTVEGTAFPTLQATFSDAGVSCGVDSLAVAVQLPLGDPELQVEHCGTYELELRAIDEDGRISEGFLLAFDTPAEPGGACPWDLDDDQDGWTESDGDCDDLDPAVFPGAIELPNGIDDDCDGTIDPPELIDDDADGYAELDGDCDDLDPAVFPGAPELVNGIDDDCDGTIDEGTDDDQDGITVQAGDCDDLDPMVHPFAHEWDDGIDNDCNGVVDDVVLAAATCGDGIVDPGEVCDDGNDVPWDGCNTTCTGGCFTWDFNDGTEQGWSSAASWDLSWGTASTQQPHTGEQLLPDPFSARDQDHDKAIHRSPVFRLDPSRPIQAWLRGGKARGTQDGPLPSSPADLAASTSASGLHAMGLALREVDSDTYLAARSKPTSGYSLGPVSIGAGSVAPSGLVTLDLFDTHAGSWGWIGLDDVEVCALPL